jgi:hypothetical protein
MSVTYWMAICEKVSISLWICYDDFEVKESFGGISVDGTVEVGCVVS